MSNIDKDKQRISDEELKDDTSCKGWVKIETEYEFWKPSKEGEELVGVVERVLNGNFGNQYVIKTDDERSVLTPSHKVLQNRMIEILEGDFVRLVFIGTEPSKEKGKNPTAMYEVYKRG